MRFIVGSSDPAQKENSISLEFEFENNRLIALGGAAEPFDIAVRGFDPMLDISYRTPEALTSEELQEETEIHIPNMIHAEWNHSTVAATLGHFVLIQRNPVAWPALSPLPALKMVLERIGTVNSAILHVEHNGILFIRNAGSEFFAGTSFHSIHAFLALEQQEREAIFPDIHASNIILTGADLDRFSDLDLGPLITSRIFSSDDLHSLCECTEEAKALLESAQHRYALIIGAALVYAEIANAF